MALISKVRTGSERLPHDSCVHVLGRLLFLAGSGVLNGTQETPFGELYLKAHLGLVKDHGKMEGHKEASAWTSIMDGMSSSIPPMFVIAVKPELARILQWFAVVCSGAHCLAGQLLGMGVFC